ncbi:MAG: aspartate aminotransferase family protein, partial [Oxalobacteraceae bacterium]
LKLVQAPGFYDALSAQTARMAAGFSEAAREAGVPFCANSVGGMFGLYFTEDVPRNYAEMMQCDKAAFNKFFHAMLDAGVYLAPSAFEAGFVSAQHGDAVIDATLDAARQAFAALR